MIFFFIWEWFLFEINHECISYTEAERKRVQQEWNENIIIYQSVSIQLSDKRQIYALKLSFKRSTALDSCCFGLMRLLCLCVWCEYIHVIYIEFEPWHPVWYSTTDDFVRILSVSVSVSVRVIGPTSEFASIKINKFLNLEINLRNFFLLCCVGEW